MVLIMKFTSNLTNVLFVLTVASGAGIVLFEHTAFIVFYIAFGLLFMLNEIARLTSLAALCYLLVFLALLILVVRGLMGFTLELTLFYNLPICAALANVVVRRGITPEAAYFIFYLIIGYLAYKMLSGADPNKLFTASRNAVSTYAISSLMLLVFLYRQGRIAVPYIPAFLCLTLSVWAIGRSGIIVSLIIFLVMLFAKDRRFVLGRSRRTKNVIRVVLITLAIIAVFSMWDKLMVMLDPYLYYLKAKGLSDVHRSDLILAYLEHIEPFEFFFGVKTETIQVFSLYSNNPHNSYISLHSSFGFIAVIMFALISYYLYKEFIAGNIVYGTIVIAFLFRIATDSQIGRIVFTFIFLTLTFYGISCLQQRPNLNAVGRISALRLRRPQGKLGKETVKMTLL